MQQQSEIEQGLIESTGISGITYHQFGGDTPVTTMKGVDSEIQFNAIKKTGKRSLNWTLTSIILIGFISLIMLIATLSLLVKITKENQSADEDWENGIQGLVEYTWNITDNIGAQLSELKNAENPTASTVFDFDQNMLQLNQTFDKLSQRIMRNFGWSVAPNGFYYKIFQETLNYNSAGYRCSSYGANLASKGIRDTSTRMYIYTKLVKPLNQITWVGLNDMNEEGTFVWSDGVVSNENNTSWGEGEPNNSGRRGEDCAHFWPSKMVDELNDGPCNRNYYFLCEALF